MRAPANTWVPAAKALLAGKTIRLPDQLTPTVTGRMSGQKGIRGKYRVNVRQTPEGVVAWLTPKEER